MKEVVVRAKGGCDNVWSMIMDGAGNASAPLAELAAPAPVSVIIRVYTAEQVHRLAGPVVVIDVEP
jgi:hypothetical protein